MLKSIVLDALASNHRLPTYISDFDANMDSFREHRQPTDSPCLHRLVEKHKKGTPRTSETTHLIIAKYAFGGHIPSHVSTEPFSCLRHLPGTLLRTLAKRYISSVDRKPGIPNAQGVLRAPRGVFREPCGYSRAPRGIPITQGGVFRASEGGIPSTRWGHFEHPGGICSNVPAPRRH